MYAIIEAGSKQYRVDENALIDVERLDAREGEQVHLDQVLLVRDGDLHIGTPYVKGARVICRVVGQHRSAKLRVFKYKPKRRYRRTQGHRQDYTRLMVEKIELKRPRRTQKAKSASEAKED